MESLIKQTRARFSGNKEERSSTIDRKTPPQKTVSYREKKRSQSWIRRQFSRQMSWDYDFSGTDYTTAVAAAAYAIQSLEESRYWDRKDTTYGPDRSLNKMKSKVDDAVEKPELPKSALKSSDGTSRASFKDPDSTSRPSTSKRMPEKEPSIKKGISFADDDEITNNKDEIEKAPERAPSLKKPPTFADKELNIAETRKPDTTLPMPDRQPKRVSTIQHVETKQKTTKPGPGDSAAEAWEKEQMASIKQRYEKLRETIDNWETKKKKKAERKIERIEAELDKERVKAVKSHRSKITRIEEIAGGARAKAEQDRRNEELKVREKANKIRSTGKLPATCLCF